VDPSTADLDRIEAALGWRPTWWRHRGSDRGTSGTGARWVVGAASGSAFVKLGATPLTATWFRREHQTYRVLRGPFIPRLLGFSDDGVVPVLAIEDLSDADWPPPWTNANVELVLDALKLVHETPAPAHMEPARELRDAGWSLIARSPEPFLALGLCSREWLAAAIHVLRDAAERAPIAGTQLLHLDVRSDNLCFRRG